MDNVVNIGIPFKIEMYESGEPHVFYEEEYNQYIIQKFECNASDDILFEIVQRSKYNKNEEWQDVEGIAMTLDQAKLLMEGLKKVIESEGKDGK